MIRNIKTWELGDGHAVVSYEMKIGRRWKAFEEEVAVNDVERFIAYLNDEIDEF